MPDISRSQDVSSEYRDILVDRHIPGMASLLDSHRVCSLPQVLALWGDRLSCRITYVRYKPATNCLIAYEIRRSAEPDAPRYLCHAKCFPAAEYPAAAAKVERHRWVERADTPPALAIPELHAVLYLFPNDPQLDGLRILATPKKLQRALYAHDCDYPEALWRISDRRLLVTPVRYKPERRAVLKLETRAVHRTTGEKQPVEAYLSVFTDDRGRAIFRTMTELHQHVQSFPNVTTPRPYAFIEDRAALLVEGLPGAPVLPGQQDFNLETVARSAHALAAIHEWDGGSLHSEGQPEILDRIHSTAETLAQIVPQEEQTARRIADRLSESTSVLETGAARFVHGDFYYGQVLCGGPRVAIVDFERSYRGDPAADVGNYCAHVRLAALEGLLQDDAALISTFLHEYRATTTMRPPAPVLRFWTALGLYLLAVRPFRILEPSWPQKITRILESCTELTS